MLEKEEEEEEEEEEEGRRKKEEEEEAQREDCELFGDVPAGHEADIMVHPFEGEAHQDELDQAATLHATDSMAEHLTGARCVNGNLIRPGPAEEEAPSTACRPNIVINAPGGVALSRDLQDLVHLEATAH